MPPATPPTPSWDESLWRLATAACQRTSSAETANAMTVYEARWFASSKLGWTPERIARFHEAHDRLVASIRR